MPLLLPCLALACKVPSTEPAFLAIAQFDRFSTLRLEQAPTDPPPILTLTLTKLEDGERRTDSTPLVALGDGTFALPLTANAPAPYWEMDIPDFPPGKDAYTAELRVELQTSSLSPQQTPPFDLILHENQWRNYVHKYQQYDYPELCLWFNWCIYAYLGFVTPPEPD